MIRQPEFNTAHYKPPVSPKLLHAHFHRTNFLTKQSLLKKQKQGSLFNFAEAIGKSRTINTTQQKYQISRKLFRAPDRKPSGLAKTRIPEQTLTRSPKRLSTPAKTVIKTKGRLVCISPRPNKKNAHPPRVRMTT